MLSYEQAIKYNNCRKSVTKAIYELTKARIDTRDYYQAYYTLQRTEFLDVDLKELEDLQVFTDGVTFLMKRKFKEGVDKISQIIKRQKFGDFLRPLLFNYRAYGLFCLGQHNKALQDLIFISETHPLEPPSQYNKVVCEAILCAQQNMF